MTNLVDLAISFINPTEKPPIFEPVTAVISILKITPNTNRMEDLVDELFWEDPADFLDKAPVIDKATREEYKRLMDFKSKNTWYEKHELRNMIYSSYLKNCSMYMTSLILNDK